MGRQWGVAKGGGTGVKLNLAVSKLLKEEQSFPHCALTDAKYLRDVCLKVAEIKQTEVKDLLSENLRDYSKVLKICLPVERSYHLSRCTDYKDAKDARKHGEFYRCPNCVKMI